MNPLVKKEIRLLLPSFVIGVALSFANFFLQDDQLGVNAFIATVSILACAGMAVFIALNSFGAEISSGTFSMLLAQPVSRDRIWRTKAWVLAVTLFVGGFLWSYILFLRLEVFGQPKGLGDFVDIFLGTWVFLPAVYSGALWTVLLFRQVAAAFWFTLLTPGAVAAIILGFWPEQYAAACEPVVIVALLIYSLAGFWFARWLFMRAQDTQWTGGTINLPEMRRLAWMNISSGTRRFWRPRAAQLVKEFQLHQSQFVLAGALVLLHLGVLATRRLGHFRKNSDTEFVLEIFWGLWLVMPMLVGAAAIAEERKLGTLEGQLYLPVKKRMQFATKFFVVLILSILFGVGMPLLMEGTWILPDFQISSYLVYANQFHGDIPDSLRLSFLWNCANQINRCLPLLTLAGMAAAIGMISFYASTFALNTLQALGPAVLGIVVTGFLVITASQPEYYYPLWSGWLIYFIGFPILTPMLIGLSFWNYKSVVVGWSGVRRNLFLLAASLALVIALTTTIYHRAWEKLTPFEPPHGVARLSQSNPVTLTEDWSGNTAIRFPDGKIWLRSWLPKIDAPSPIAFALGNHKFPSFDNGYFLESSNWSDVIRTRFQWVGLKSDGTLWATRYLKSSEWFKNGKPSRELENLSQFGDETNWNSISPGYEFILLMKKDGTSWRWGATNWDYGRHEWPGLQVFTPLQLRKESDWSQTFEVNNRLAVRKKDCSVWMQDFADDRDKEAEKIEIEPGIFFGRVTSLENGTWRSTAAVRYGAGFRLGIRSDGTFRIWADEQLDRQQYYKWVAVDFQIGKETNWLAVAGYGEKIVTLKRDGSLWLWDYHYDWRNGWYGNVERQMLEIAGKTPIRLGKYSDWIAIASGNDNGITSLAADGSLWYWPLEREVYWYGNDKQFEPLLDMSHKPQLLGNVFSKTN